MNVKNLVLAIVITIVLLGAGIAIGFVAFRGTNVSVTTNDDFSEITNSGVAADTNNAINGNTNMFEPEPLPTVPPETTNAPKEIANLRLVKPDPNTTPGSTTETYYDTGAITSGKYAGQKLVLLVYLPEGPYFYPEYFRFAQKGTELTLLSLHSGGYADYLEKTKFTTDTTTTLKNLDYPKTLQGKTTRQTLTLDPAVNAFFDETGLKVAFADATWGKVYMDDGSGKAERPFNSNGFYLRAPDGTVRVYALDVDFQNDSGVLDIRWNDGSKNFTAYTVAEVGGCGRTNYTFVVTDGSYAVGKNLKQTGTSSKGDPIYEITDTKDTLLKTTYDEGYWKPYDVNGKQETTYTYQQYLDTRPFIFWTDPFGRLVRAQNNTFVPQAECGKPVIYLYPEQAMDVSVKVEPQGGMTKSDPVYNDGWAVHAKPDGALTEKASKKSYPYLFWEGRGSTIYEQPSKGFVVARNDVPGFLDVSLAKYGLSAREVADFKEFWVPRMQSAPYYFISFLGNREMDTLAPLIVTPKPDTIIRVLMDFRPLEKPTPARPYSIRTPERKGFTVVEWGGVLR